MQGQLVGSAADLSAPLVDTRGWYVLSPLARATRMSGILYVDGHREPAPRGWETAHVRVLTAVASAALENAHVLQRTQELALRDPLTELLNRRAFEARLADMVASRARTADTFALVMIDVDDFKNINDRFGHSEGDCVLRRIADALRAECRGEDVAARYAGDEFVLLLPGISASAAPAHTERLTRTLCRNGLRCSLGVAVYPKNGTTAAELVSAADRALYSSKRAGKGAWTLAGSGAS